MPLRKELINRYTRRKMDHDYYGPCHYHIILRKAETAPFFGQLSIVSNPSFEAKEAAVIEYNTLGKIISVNAFNFDKYCPNLKMYQYKVMPDHVHMFLRVKDKTEKHLGDYISFFKGRVAQEYSKYCKKEITHKEIFESNYTDRIVFVKRDFNVIYRYIEMNPFRLAIRFKNPKFFERRAIMTVDSYKYETYGNHFILENPFKKAVHVPFAASQKDFEEIKENCLEHVAGGGVLVSPFISQREKEIRQLAIIMGGRIIQIKNKKFNEKYKPFEEDFKLCSKGQLLEIAPVFSFGDVSKPVCRKMNDLAAKISEGEYYCKEISANPVRGTA